MSFPKSLKSIRKKNTWKNIRLLVDDSVVPLSKQPSVICFVDWWIFDATLLIFQNKLFSKKHKNKKAPLETFSSHCFIPVSGLMLWHKQSAKWQMGKNLPLLSLVVVRSTNWDPNTQKYELYFMSNQEQINYRTYTDSIPHIRISWIGWTLSYNLNCLLIKTPVGERLLISSSIIGNQYVIIFTASTTPLNILSCVQLWYFFCFFPSLCVNLLYLYFLSFFV